MKPFQRLTTVIALALLASLQAVAAPASENQLQSDSQSATFPIPSGNVAVSNIGTVGNQIGVISGTVPPNTVVVSNDGIQPNGANVVELNSPDGGKLADSIINNVDNQLAAAFGSVPSTVVGA